MNGGNLTLCGLYLNLAGVRECAHSLTNAGIDPCDISVLLQNGSIVSVAPLTRDGRRLDGSDENHFNARENSVGLSSGSLIRTLLSLGIPVYDAERLTVRICNGGILVMVRCKDHGAAQIIRQGFIGTGAHDLSSGRKPGSELQRCTQAGYSQRPAQYRTAHA